MGPWECQKHETVTRYPAFGVPQLRGAPASNLGLRPPANAARGQRVTPHSAPAHLTRLVTVELPRVSEFGFAKRMWFESPSAQQRIRAIAHSLSPGDESEQDLAQEALLRLWLIETRSPGHRPSWYLQNCRRHLLDLLRSGRSLDAHKRRELRCPIATDLGNEDPEEDESQPLACNDCILERVALFELMDLISPVLSHRAGVVLKLLIDGASVGDTARELGISPGAVRKHRRHIASAAALLGT